MGKIDPISNPSWVAYNYYRHQFNILINTLRRSLTITGWSTPAYLMRAHAGSIFSWQQQQQQQQIFEKQQQELMLY
jgi:hypothetical protein